MKIYLSGWVGEIGYRRYMLQTYSKLFDVIDPMLEVQERLELRQSQYKSFSNDDVTKVVEGDIELLKNCDVLVAMMNRYSAGTIMEIRIAYDLDIPIYIIDPSGNMRYDIWLRHHSNLFFDDIDPCVNFLKGTYL